MEAVIVVEVFQTVLNVQVMQILSHVKIVQMDTIFQEILVKHANNFMQIVKFAIKMVNV